MRPLRTQRLTMRVLDEADEAFYRALYTDAQGTPTHAARQLESGDWTSKLGKSVDIRHSTLAALGGEMYGRVAFLLRRPRELRHATARFETPAEARRTRPPAASATPRR